MPNIELILVIPKINIIKTKRPKMVWIKKGNIFNWNNKNNNKNANIIPN